MALLTLKTKHVQTKKKPSVNEILTILIKMATDVTCTLADMILQSFVDKKINTSVRVKFYILNLITINISNLSSAEIAGRYVTGILERINSKYKPL